MSNKASLLKDRELKYNKALGCLGGLAVGDTMGEMSRNEVFREKYGVVLSLYGDSQSTDDTEFALLTADTVIKSKGNLQEEDVYQAWMKHVVKEGIHDRAGIVSSGAMLNLQRGKRAPLSGKDNVHSYDDAVAMRIAPVGIVCAGDPERAAAMAKIDGEISNYADGVWAGQAIAASIAVAMVDGDIEEIIEAGVQYIPADSWLNRSMKQARNIINEEKTLFKSWDRLHDELSLPYRASAPEAITQIYALLELIGDLGFEKMVIIGSNFGRDSDTIGAVLGAFGGAKYGAKSIPPGWLEKVRKPRGVCLPFTSEMDIFDVSRQLADLIG